MKLRSLAATAAALAVTLALPGSARPAELTLEEVATGVWAALQDEAARFNDSNSVVVISDRDVVVIDSQADSETVGALIAKIGELTEVEVRYLVNTHFHSDHTRGNFLYRDAFPSLEIVGHPTLIEDITGRSAPDLDKEIETYRREIPAAEVRLEVSVSRDGEPLDAEGKATLASQIAAAKAELVKLESIEWAVPTLTVPTHLTLHRNLGPIEIRAVHAHTRGDLIVYLPQSKVLVTGDVLDDLPYGGHGFPSDWVSVLDELESWDWDIMVPGHGRVRRGEEARQHLERVSAHFKLMISSAKAAVAAGENLDTARESFLASEEVAAVRLELAGEDPVAQRNFDYFVPAGFERAYLEAKGELPD